MKWALDIIKKLQEAHIGDQPRLESINNTIRKGRIVYESDKNYLETKFNELNEKQIEDQSKNKEDELSFLRKKIEELERKVDKQPEDGFTFEPEKMDNIRRDVSYIKKQNQLTKKTNSMKKDIGTITLVSVIGGLFGINGLGHFMIGKNGTGVGYLLGGIVTMALFGLATAGYGAILPWIIFLIAGTLSARTSTEIWNKYIDVFVIEPSWKDIEKKLQQINKTKTQSETKVEPKKISETSDKRKNKILLILFLILAIIVIIWIMDNYGYEIHRSSINSIFNEEREPTQADKIRRDCYYDSTDGIMYSRSGFKEWCQHGQRNVLDAELSLNPFD